MASHVFLHSVLNWLYFVKILIQGAAYSLAQTCKATFTGTSCTSEGEGTRTASAVQIALSATAIERDVYERANLQRKP